MSQDLTSIEWRYPEWIAQVGGLTSDNVLEYFSMSPFWDNTSNNAVLKMQTTYNSLEDSISKLRTMRGVEFEVTDEKYGKLFIITKQKRESLTSVKPMAKYYIINGNIYQAPDLYSILGNRMLTMINQIHSAFRETYKFVEFNPATGYNWKVNPPKDEDKEDLIPEKQKVAEYQNSMDRVFFSQGLSEFVPKKPKEPVSKPKVIRVVSSEEALAKIAEDRRLRALKTAEYKRSSAAKSMTSTPSSSADGTRAKRKSEGLLKKKKKAKSGSVAPM